MLQGRICLHKRPFMDPGIGRAARLLVFHVFGKQEDACLGGRDIWGRDVLQGRICLHKRPFMDPGIGRAARLLVFHVFGKQEDACLDGGDIWEKDVLQACYERSRWI